MKTVAQLSNLSNLSISTFKTRTFYIFLQSWAIYIFTVIVLSSRTSTVFPATFSVRRILTDRPTASKSNLSRHVPSGLRGQGQEVD